MQFDIDSDVMTPRERINSLIGREPMPETSTVNQVMDVLKCSRTTVYKLVNEGELTIIKVFGKSLILGLRDFIEKKAAEARQ